MFSPEEEFFAQQFLNPILYGRRSVLHTQEQLEHIETQIGRVQAGLRGQGPPQVISYDIKDIRLPYLFGRRTNVRVGEQFLKGMITTARYLRRNIR